jgi:hypothetical protein
MKDRTTCFNDPVKIVEKFPAWYMTFLTDVMICLPRPGDGPQQIDKETAETWRKNRAGMKRGLAEYLCPPPAKRESDFKVWKTLNPIPELVTVDDYIEAFQKANMTISPEVLEILHSVGPILDTVKKCNFTEASPDTIGLRGNRLEINRERFFQKAYKSGLRPCKIEEVLQMRLQYENQSMFRGLGDSHHFVTNLSNGKQIGGQRFTLLLLLSKDIHLKGNFVDVDGSRDLYVGGCTEFIFALS